MKKSLTFLFVLLSLLLVACGNAELTPDTVVATDDTFITVSSVPVAETEKNSENLYPALFDLNSRISIKVDISKTELDKIQRDYEYYSSFGSKSPIYRKADKVTFTVNGEEYVINEVGIRMKGNTSRMDLFDPFTGQVNMLNFRLSFSQTFDNENYYGKDAKVWDSDEERSERKNRTFATLECLELKWNKNYDNTHVCEYYAYSMFRDNGVLAPQINLTTFTMSDIYYGVYNIYEPVDKIFIERNLPEEDWDGDLYKVAWTHQPANYTKQVTYGVEDEDKAEFYNFDLKTNKSKSSHEQLKNLLEVINSSDVTLEAFSDVVDNEYWSKFAAVSYFTGNPDDMRNNYNNHYVYFLKSSGKAIFIPYDYDRTMGITTDWNPSGSGMTNVSPYSANADGNDSKQANPLYNLSAQFLMDEYNAALLAIAESKWMTADYFESIYNIAKANYENDVNPSTDFGNVRENNFYFSIESNKSMIDPNLDVSDYIERILKTFDDNYKSIK